MQKPTRTQTACRVVRLVLLAVTSFTFGACGGGDIGRMGATSSATPNVMDESYPLSELRMMAEQGNAEAQYALGLRYFVGIGMPENITEAVKWYRRSAELGYADAQVSLGARYLIGNGVLKDDTEAVRWFRRAAEQGHAEAQFRMAASHDIGEGVLQDHAEAVKWFRRAAEQGHAGAQFRMSVRYSNGLGVPKDDVKAANWLRKATEQEEGLRKTPEIALDVDYDREGTARYDARAQFRMGVRYHLGFGVPQDDTKAEKWYRLAAEQGHDGARNILGWEMWRCFATNDYNKTTVLITLTRMRGGIREFGEVSVAGTTYSTPFRIVGLNRRWDFGSNESRDRYPYAFVIEPDGTGLYFDFSTSTDGTAKPRNFFECLMSP